MAAGAVDDRRQEVLDGLQAEQRQGLVVVGQASEVAEGVDAFARAGRTHARGLEEEPVLAMHGRCGPYQALGLVRLQPQQLAALHRRVERVAGARGDEPRGRRLAQRLHVTAGARVEPQHRGSDRAAIGIDEPRSVALAGGRQGHHARRQAGDARGQRAQRGCGVGPGSVEVLLGRAVGAEQHAVRRAGHRHLPALQVEGHGLDDRGSGVHADDEVACHARQCRPPNERVAFMGVSRGTSRPAHRWRGRCAPTCRGGRSGRTGRPAPPPWPVRPRSPAPPW